MSKSPSSNAFAKRPASKKDAGTNKDDTADDGGTAQSGRDTKTRDDDGPETRIDRAEDRQRDSGVDANEMRQTGIPPAKGGNGSDAAQNDADDFILGHQDTITKPDLVAPQTADHVTDEFGDGSAAVRADRELRGEEVDVDALLNPDIGAGSADDILRRAGAPEGAGEYGTGNDIFELGETNSPGAIANVSTEPGEAELEVVGKMLDIATSIQAEYETGDINLTERYKQTDAVIGGIQNVQETYRPEDVYVQETGAGIGKNLKRGDWVDRSVASIFGISDKDSPDDMFRHKQTGEMTSRDQLPDNAIEKDGRSTIKEQSEAVEFDDLPKDKNVDNSPLKTVWDRYKPSGKFDQEKAAREQQAADAKAAEDAKAAADAQAAADAAEDAAAEEDNSAEMSGEEDIVTGEEAAASAQRLSDMGFGELLQKRNPRDGAIDPGEDGSAVDITGDKGTTNSGGIEQPTGEAVGGPSGRTNPRDGNVDPHQDDVAPSEGRETKLDDVGLKNDDLSHLNPGDDNGDAATLTPADIDLMNRTVRDEPPAAQQAEVDDSDADPASLDDADGDADDSGGDPAMLDDGSIGTATKTAPITQDESINESDDNFGAPAAELQTDDLATDLTIDTATDTDTDTADDTADQEAERRAQQQQFQESEEAIILTPIDTGDDSSSGDSSADDAALDDDAAADDEVPDDIAD